jgi:ABC-type polysaccharide/polyol phosphate export permease
VSAAPPTRDESPRLQWAKNQAYALAYLTYYGLIQQYSRALLGMLWFLITPVLLLLVYGFVLVAIYRVPGADNFSFALVILCGIMPWAAFSDGLGSATSSILNFPVVIRNSPLPALFLPTVKVIQAFLGLGFALAVTVLVAGVGGQLNPVRLIVIPYAYVTFFFFTLGMAWLLSALAVYVRDVVQAVSTALLVGLFASPVLYTREMVEGMPFYVHAAVAWNPVTPYLELVRSMLVDRPLYPRDLVLAPALALLSMALGVGVFRKLESGMADSL